ncbi:hypothetical protein PG985_004904 [Apiospora marii]|uniref:uncharacterized protein n=1 Tax=Apiospora marii TaxID=335849 RepID=UPI003131006C
MEPQASESPAERPGKWSAEEGSRALFLLLQEKRPHLCFLLCDSWARGIGWGVLPKKKASALAPGRRLHKLPHLLERHLVVQLVRVCVPLPMLREMLGELQGFLAPLGRACVRQRTGKGAGPYPVRVELEEARERVLDPTLLLAPLQLPQDDDALGIILYMILAAGGLWHML